MSQRKQPLSESELFFEGVIGTSSKPAVIASDPNGTIRQWNEGASLIYGFEASEVVGKLSIQDLHPGFTGPDVLCMPSGTDTWEGTYDGVRKGGEQFRARVIANSIDGPNGEVVRIVFVAQDLSTAFTAETRLRQVLESAPDAMVIVDQQGRIALLNSQTEVMFGYPRDEILGQPVEMLVPSRYHRRHHVHRTRFVADPTVRPMGEGLDLLGLKSDGSEFPVEISLSPLDTGNGVFVTAAIRDVTEQKKTKDALREWGDQLERALQARDRFLASMSHELRTPLNAIIGFSGTLLMKLPGPLTDDQEKQLGIIRRSGNHLLSLINDLLDLAKIESGRVESHPEPLSPDAEAEEVLTTLRPTAEAKGLTLILDTSRAPTCLLADKRMLRQVLINLTNNAIKFTDEGSVIVTVESIKLDEEGWCRFSIADTGIGISDKDQARLFEPFSQVRGRGVKEREGTGLGLHLCRTVANLIGGVIEFTSRPGEGSTFSLRLPLS